MLITSRKKVVGDSSGNWMRPEAPPGPRAVDGGGLDQRLRDRLQAGQEEQEVVGDLLPDRGHHDQRHRVVGIEQVVPVDADLAQRVGHDAERRREHEHPQHGGHGGCTGWTRRPPRPAAAPPVASSGTGELKLAHRAAAPSALSLGCAAGASPLQAVARAPRRRSSVRRPPPAPRSMPPGWPSGGSR